MPSPPCFNSLQTGNCIQTGSWRNHLFPRLRSFNSLQTGNCIQTHFEANLMFLGAQVSIPFKRETAFKRTLKQTLCSSAHKFQFPSNGKLHSNRFPSVRPPKPRQSFNSLQTGNCIQTRPETAPTHEESSFNSLQTGNCIQTLEIQMLMVGDALSFNSLQTGNCIQTHRNDFRKPLWRLWFQFPSNGKLHSNSVYNGGPWPSNEMFQFPSNGKLHSN